MALFHFNGAPVGSVAIMLALVASMGGFIFGYDTGQISNILLLDDFCQRFAGSAESSGSATCDDWPTTRSGLIVSVLSIGTLFGALMGAPIADAIGRRWAMVVECFVFCIGLVIQITAFTVWQQVAVGRAVAGIAIGALSAAVPMYQAETAPPQLRGTLMATYQLFITAGILAAYSIAFGTRAIGGMASWKLLIGLGFVWAAILVAGILTMPESPRWLATKGRREAAAKSIARIYGISKKEAATNRYVQAELDEIFNQVENEKRFKGGWIDCFRPTNKTLYRTFLGMTLQSLQQLTGANYFFYYGATIFQGVGISDSFVSQVILGGVNFGCTFGGLYVMERFGRRWPLIIGGVWQSIWLFVFASAGTARDPTADENIGILMIVCACMFILGYAMTWGPGIWILIGETFPTRTRAKQGALSTASNWTWNFLIAFFTPLITQSIGFTYGYVFASCNLLAAGVVFFFLYESSDLTLESVDDMYNDPKCKPWTSNKWVPVGYSSRNDLVEQTKAAQAHKPLAELAEEERIEHAAGPSPTPSGTGAGNGRVPHGQGDVDGAATSPSPAVLGGPGKQE